METLKKSQTIGIVIDAYKLPIFKKTLDKEGYEYSEKSGPIVGCITLKVKTKYIAKLARLVDKMNQDYENSKLN